MHAWSNWRRPNLIKLLSISGSPVEGSSTDILLKEIEKGFLEKAGSREETQISFYKLNELNFIACQACGKAPTPEYCFYDDDLTRVYAELAVCDCLLVGSPIYFDTVSGQLKSFMDRCNCVRPADFDNTDPQHDFLKLIAGKRPGAMVLVGGERGYFEGARRTIAGFFKWIEVTNQGMVIHKSDDFHKKGAVVDDSTALKEARELGAKLAVQVLAR